MGTAHIKTLSGQFIANGFAVAIPMLHEPQPGHVFKLHSIVYSTQDAPAGTDRFGFALHLGDLPDAVIDPAVLPVTAFFDPDPVQDTAGLNIFAPAMMGPGSAGASSNITVVVPLDSFVAAEVVWLIVLIPDDSTIKWRASLRWDAEEISKAKWVQMRHRSMVSFDQFGQHTFS